MFQFFSQLNHIQFANQFDLFDSTCLFVQLNVCSPALVTCGVKMCQDVSRFLFMAKGGGSANKTYLYQQTKAQLEAARATIDAMPWPRRC